MKKNILFIILLIAVGYMSFNAGKNTPQATDLVIPTHKKVFFFGEAPERYASFKGTWETDGERYSFPNNVIEYKCNEAEGYCTVSEAAILDNFLDIFSGTLKIIKWDDEKILIGPLSTIGLCRVETIRVDLLTKEIKSITDNADNAALKDCTLPRLDKAKVAYLIDGFERHLKQSSEK